MLNAVTLVWGSLRLAPIMEELGGEFISFCMVLLSTVARCFAIFEAHFFEKAWFQRFAQPLNYKHASISGRMLNDTFKVSC